MEIGNSVFMAYQRTNHGFEPLEKQNVDFGGGLERIAAAHLENPDVFAIDVFDKTRQVIESVSGISYHANEKTTWAFRIILDHVRAATFLIADGAVPSNKDQGYFTRRLIRRAVRYGNQIGIGGHFCGQVAGAFFDMYSNAYPELAQKKEMIVVELEKEEKKFGKTLVLGTKQFEEIASGNASFITAIDAFDLYQSFGFPIELTVELAKERGLTVDEKGFEQEKEKHAALSRQGSEQKFKGGLADHSEMSVKYHTATHLLHAAVLKVLGSHATQKGSNITPERLRFDFSHSEKMTDAQKKQVEDLINAAIEKDYPVTFAMMSVDEARKKGAIGLFDENYGDQVKVYTVGDPNEPVAADSSAPAFSREFCGGPHVEHTGVLGRFKIVKEEAVSAGIRRIKAVLE